MQKTIVVLLVLILAILIGGGWWYFSKSEEQAKARTACGASISYMPVSQTSAGEIGGGYYYKSVMGFEPLCPLGKQCRYGSYEEAMSACVGS